MENQDTSIEMYGKFTWTIRNFSTLDSKILSSDTFSLDGHRWRILILPNGNSVNCLPVYLDGDADTVAHGWEKFANFQLILINQLKNKRNIINESSHTFNSKQGVWHFSVISLDEFLDSSRGFIVNDTCIIEAHISVHTLENEKQGYESGKNSDNKLVESIENLSPTELVSTLSFDEVVDFRAIGKVDKDFIPLLEDVFSRYPSLIDNKKKRSQKFAEWTFTALGRVLHFLNTKKARDMDDNAYNHLKILWEELETCGFDLSWLKPHVQSALSMKTWVEKTLSVKRLEEYLTNLEEKVAILEMEAITLMTKRIEADVEIEIYRRVLVKVKEDFENCDLDAELGYGKP